VTVVDLEISTVHSGKLWASVYQNLNYAVDLLCQPVYIYLMHINSIVLTQCIMKTELSKILVNVFSLHNTHKLLHTCLTSSSLEYSIEMKNSSCPCA